MTSLLTFDETPPFAPSPFHSSHRFTSKPKGKHIRKRSKSQGSKEQREDVFPCLSWFIRPKHGCCWDTFYIVAYYGLAGHSHLTAKYAPFPTLNLGCDKPHFSLWARLSLQYRLCDKTIVMFAVFWFSSFVVGGCRKAREPSGSLGF